MVRLGFRSTCVARTNARKYLRNRESHSLAVCYQPVYSRTKALSRRILSYAKDVTRREAKWPKIQMMDDVRRGDLSWVPIPELEPDAVGLALEHHSSAVVGTAHASGSTGASRGVRDHAKLPTWTCEETGQILVASSHRD
ncbi:hypothetical protein A0H81_07460 [Grifola frondosa]|uniref:Uncharacterized protein n=1 Tax=Grifola frondosa TaxID=5627 RepID=A0A1C7M7A1_GRIFR|nr:hypothetical protein A0H81_07460 [Grifola frondosa]